MLAIIIYILWCDYGRCKSKRSEYGSSNPAPKLSFWVTSQYCQHNIEQQITGRTMCCPLEEPSARLWNMTVPLGWHYLSNPTSLILGAEDCTPEIDTSEIIVDCQWQFPMGCQLHCSNGISLVSSIFQRIVTCPVDAYWNCPMDSVAFSNGC